MKVIALVAAACPLAACTSDSPPTALDQYTGARVTLQTMHEAQQIEPGVPTNTTLTISPPAGACLRIADDVTADLDGVRMTVTTRGGAWRDIDASGCDDASFSLDHPLATTGPSTLLIRDANTTWTITGDNLFANDFTLADAPVAGQHTHIVWGTAQTIDDGAYVQLEQGSTVVYDTAQSETAVTAQGNVIDLAMPANVTGEVTMSLNSARTAPATRCDGPATCTLQVFAGADLPVTIAASPSPQADRAAHVTALAAF